MENPIICKNCGSAAVIKYGRYKTVQRYLCKACLRKFKADTAGFHMKVPSEYVNRVLNMYYDVISIPTILETLKSEQNIYISKSMIYRWIKRYTDSADAYFKHFHPEVGGAWIVKERTLELDGPRMVWIYDVLDSSTRFLLSSQVSAGGRMGKLELILKAAVERSSRVPEELILDVENSNSGGIGQLSISTFNEMPDRAAFRGNLGRFYNQGISESAVLITYDSSYTPELSVRFDAQIGHTIVPRPFKSLDSFISFIKGWSVYYNYYKPHSLLSGRTPAEQAQINHIIKNWTGT